MSIEEAIEEINRRSIKLSAVSKGALISSQNFAVASDPGYTVAYTGNQLQPGSTLGLTYHFLHP